MAEKETNLTFLSRQRFEGKVGNRTCHSRNGGLNNIIQSLDILRKQIKIYAASCLSALFYPPDIPFPPDICRKFCCDFFSTEKCA